MTGPYINDFGYEVPENTVVVIPHGPGGDPYLYKDILVPLSGNSKRDWFTPHFYYCLPLTIGNQYGFIIKSLHDFDITWEGGLSPVNLEFKDSNKGPQYITNGFGSGIVTVQNPFSIKTPIGINIITIHPPNMFIPGLTAMTAVVETDQIRRDFTFNLKVTVPNYKITVKKGDAIGAFIPIPRYFVEKFRATAAADLFPAEVLNNEYAESSALGQERATVDKVKPHTSGRRYFKGTHTNDSKYPDHQKRLH